MNISSRDHEGFGALFNDKSELFNFQLLHDMNDSIYRSDSDRHFFNW